MRTPCGAASTRSPASSPDQLGLSSQCGFASVAGGNALAEEPWAKLQSVVDTAQRVWGH